jgi:hypothetical protein
MAQQIVRGNTITLDAFLRDGGVLVDADSLPQVSILDPSGAVVVELDAPTHESLGHYQYKYPVAVDADLGAWAIKWFAVIDGADAEDEDGFTVLREAGSGPQIGFAAGFQHAIAACSPWSSAGDVLDRYPDYSGDQSVLEDACVVASDVLYELTGRRWSGRCHDKIRPTAQWRASSGGPTWWASGSGLGSRGSLGFCSCNRGRETGCARIPEIKLPGAPVDPNSIVVTINGVDFTDFALHDGRYLVRTDGDGWPCCQDLTLEATEDHTFQIEYDHGANPPPGGAVASRMYAYQLALSMDPAAVNAGKCLLPKRVTSITRLNTTVTVLDPMTLIKDGLVGLALVDQWVASTRIGAQRRRATVLIPGRYRSARRIS